MCFYLFSKIATVSGGPEHALLVTRGIYGVAFGRGEVAGSSSSTASLQVKLWFYFVAVLKI